jgi:hypothetical protein
VFVADVADVAVEALPVSAPINVVEVTLDRPAIVKMDEPKDTAVEPMVILLFVS